MNRSNFTRATILNLITALIITYVACYFLSTINLTSVLYISNIFGLYFLVVYGIDILIESGDVKNNYQRFLLAIALIIIFDLIFLILTPLLFGANALSVSDYLIMVFDGIRFDLTMDVIFYLGVFAVLMMVFNLLLYLKDRKVYNN